MQLWVHERITKFKKICTSETTDKPSVNVFDLGVLKLFGADAYTKHVYIFLGSGWVFERVGNDESLPYRLAPRDAIYCAYRWHHTQLAGLYVEEIIKIKEDVVATTLGAL